MTFRREGQPAPDRSNANTLMCLGTAPRGARYRSEPVGEMPFVVLGIVAVTLLLALVRPGGFSEGVYAAIGAAAMLLTGAVEIGAIPHLLRDTSEVLLFLAGMLLLTAIVERAHVFDVVAAWIAQAAGHRGIALHAGMALLAILVTTFLSLDVTVILLPVIVLHLARRHGFDPVPMLFSVVFLANISSLALPVSNLTNLLIVDTLDLGFRPYVVTMFVPNLVATVTVLGLLWLLFRHRVPRVIGAPLPDADQVPVPTPWTGLAAIGLAATLGGLLVLGFAGLPLWWAAVPGGGVLALIAVGTGRVGPRAVAHALSPGIFLFVIGMMVVIEGFRKAWLDGRVIDLPSHGWAASGLAMLANALGSNVVNNVPMVLLSATVIERADAGLRDALAYGSLVGANIGPALTTYGSLATILWLALLRRNGIEISTREYLSVSLAVVPVTLVTTTIALWLVL